MARNKKRKGKVVKMKQKLTPEKYIRQAARKLPVKKVLVSDNISELGLGHVIIVREKPNGDLITGVYLVDKFACGVKNSYFTISDEDGLEEMISRFEEVGNIFEEQDPNYAFNLIYGAVEYAEDIGLEPHKSFSLTSYILDDVDDIDFVDIEFGKDGKPLYIQGPNDNSGRILSILNNTIGADNYNFISKGDLDFNDEYDDDFDSDFDGDFDDEYDDEWDYLESLIVDMPDKNRFLLFYYDIVATNVFEYVDGDIDKLLRNYETGLNVLVLNIKEFILDKSNEDIFEFMEEFDNLYQLNVAIIETVISYGGIDFLSSIEFIRSFLDNDDQGVYDFVHSLEFFNFGKEKINELLKALSVFILQWNRNHPDELLGDPLNPFEFYKKYNEGKYDVMQLDYEIILVLEMVYRYEEQIEEINENFLEKINFEDFIGANEKDV